MSKPLRIGMIGIGGRGYLAHAAHRPEEGVRVVAGADPNTATFADFHARFGPDAFTTTDYRALLARPDVDAVLIVSPDFCHEEHAVAALEAKKAVYLEKPMAITIAGCDHILAAARDHGAKLYLGHNMRHFAMVRRMKQLIDAGEIGEVRAGWCRHFVSYGGDAYFKDWHAERKNTTGLLLQKGAHDIDILHWLCGGYTRRVTAMGGLSVYNRTTDRRPADDPGNKKWVPANWPPLSQKLMSPAMDVEDLSMMLMELSNGVQCSYQQCHFTPDSCRNYTIIGTEGRLENFGDNHGVVRLWNRRTDTYKGQGDEEYPFEPGHGGHGGADTLIVQEFIRYVREDAPISTSPVGARYAVAAACCATESLRAGGRPVDVPAVDPELAAYIDQAARQATPA